MDSTKFFRREQIAYLILTVGIVLLMIVPSVFNSGAFIQTGDSAGMMPRPTDEGMNDHERREQWMADMHQAAPGTNWRMMDLQYRLKRSRGFRGNQLLTGDRSVSIAGVVQGMWQERGSSNQAGRILLAELDTVGQWLYCASDGGQIWRTPSAASVPQWQVMTDHIQFKGIHFLRIFRQAGLMRVVIATNQGSTPGVYYSDDTCNTWTAATGTQTASWGYVRRVVTANDGQNTLYALAQGWNSSAVVRLLKSTDLGVSFQEITSFPESQVGSIRKCDIWSDRYGSGRVFMVKDSVVTELIQGQLSLKGTLQASPQNQARLTGYERGGAVTLYLMDAGSNNSTCYRSVNDGSTWTWRGDVQETPFMINSFASSATDPDLLYYGGVEAFRSPTAGTNWYLVNAWGDYYGQPANRLHADLPGFCSFIGNGGTEVLYICTDGGIYKSTNGMQTVSNLSMLDLNVSQYYSVYTSRVNTSFIHAGSQDQGYQRSNSTPGAVRSFDQVWSGDYGHIVSGDGGLSIWMNYPGFTVHYNDILYSTSRAWWEFTFENALWIPPMIIDPYDKNNVLIGGGGFNGGAHIIQVTYMGPGAPMVTYEFPFDFSGGSSSVKICALATSPLDKDCWYVLTTNGRLYHSANSGDTWTLKHNFNFSFGHYFYGADIVPSPNEKGKLYVCGSGYSNPPVFEISDFGAVVKPINNGIPNTLVYALDCTPEEGLLFAATELGPFVYVSSEEKWYDLSEGYAPDQTWWSVDYVESLKTARFGTYGRGIWDFIMCNGTATQPVAAFTSQSGTGYLEVEFTDQSSGGPFTWLWDFGDGKTSTQPSPTHVFAAPGTYTITLIAGNVCHRDTLKKSIQVTQTGITEQVSDAGFTLFPNPNTGSFFITNRGYRPEGVRILGIDGRELYRTSWMDTGSGSMQITAENLPPGIYWAELMGGPVRRTAKLIIR
ncbi:MAG TPA: PKD domain-containing protein [Bacteroidales bacterium]|nr:PKD domain-containing protein [Bacteroidales bacterium]HRZ49364.1 PKD domain-containing protein [Bacteroidales bacterium]